MILTEGTETLGVELSQRDFGCHIPCLGSKHRSRVSSVRVRPLAVRVIINKFREVRRCAIFFLLTAL